MISNRISTSTTTRKPAILLFLLSFVIQANFCLSQAKPYPVNEWIKKICNKEFYGSSSMQEIYTALAANDSLQVSRIFKDLEHKGAGAGKYFLVNLYILKAIWLRQSYGCSVKQPVSELVKKILDAAYEEEDDNLVSYVSWFYGQLMYACLDMEPAAMYCLNAIELDQKAGTKITPYKYGILGDVLYVTQDYEKSAEYTRKAIEEDTGTSAEIKHVKMSRWNTIGLCCQKMSAYDSALFYFDIALALAEKENDPVWQGIISGNKGQVYFQQKKYALAKPLLEADYRESKAYGELGNAANSLQWVARINLKEGKKDSALMQVKEAMHLIQRMGTPGYLQNVLHATADVYSALGNYDSASKYAGLYNHLHDSLERKVADSRLEMSRIKVDNLQNALTIKTLHKEKQAAELKRNFLIAVIALLAIIALLYVNRQRIKNRHKVQLTMEQQKAADAEIAAAKEQLQSFTKNIIEKTTLIEQLEQQLSNRTVSLEQQELISHISSLTILTENDWEKFKSIFEKIYPGFFIQLKEKVSDITVAELRMAALTRLDFSVHQIASMLGISSNSVYKTKQRLRQRFNVNSDQDIEDILSKI